MTASTINNNSAPFFVEKGVGGHAILSTKLLPAALVQAIREKGGAIDCIPFIETAPVTDIAMKNEVQQLAKQGKYVAFTSGIAAQAVAAMLTTQPTWKIFSLHNQTRKNVEACFPQSAIVATAQYGAGLANEILSRAEIKELVFFCGDKRMNILPTLLPQNGIQLHEYVVYTTKLTPVKLARPYKAILFYSPSGVESFCSANTVDKDALLFSIGTTTTEAIRKKMNNQVYTAATATVEGVIEKVIQTINLK